MHRKDSFITHRAFCDALAEESARLSANPVLLPPPSATTNPHLFHPNSQNPSSLFPFQVQQHQQQRQFLNSPTHISLNLPWDIPQTQTQTPSPNPNQNQLHIKPESIHIPVSSPFYQSQLPPTPTHKRPMPSPFQSLNDSIVLPAPNTVHHLSATALLQKAAALGAHSVGHVNSTMTQLDMSNIGPVANRNPPPEYPSFTPGNLGAGWQKNDRLTRDFLGLTGDHQHCGGGGGSSSINGNANGNIDVNLNVNMRGVLSFTGSVEFPAYERDFSLLKPKSFGFAEGAAPETWGNC